MTTLKRAMILAAGRGQRLRPLTDSMPKPLVPVHGRPLIEWHLERLRRGGIREVAINHSWLGAQLTAALGDGARFGLSIRWFDEGPVPLETAGGIVNALPFFGAEPFVVINGDVFSDYALPPAPERGCLAHLVLVPNPAEHPRGDFGIECGELRFEAPARFTYAGFASYDPRFFAGLAAGPRRLKPLWDRGAAAGLVSVELHRGDWTDVGTLERLTALNARVR